MSWRDIASKDVSDASRSRTVWLLGAVLSVLFVGYAGVQTVVGDVSAAAFVDGLAGLVASFVPILAILLGYRSISDDRDSGSLLLVLSFPHSRRDLVVGTFVGRTVVLLAPTLAALTVAGAVGVAHYGLDLALPYAWFLLATAGYGTAFLGVAVGLSLSTTVDRRITYGAIGAYLLLGHLWAGLVSFVVAVLFRFQPGLSMPDWGLFLQLVQPSQAFDRLVRVGFEVDRAGRYLGDAAPVYVDWWAAVALLVTWSVLPLVAGYLRFSRVDL